MSHNPLPNHGIQLPYHRILKDAVKNYGLLYTVLLIILKYLHRQTLQSFYQQLKEPEAHLGKKKNHHIFIRFLEAGPLKIVQVLQFITC